MNPIAFGIVHGLSGCALLRLRRRPARAVEAEQPALCQGSSRHSSAAASAAPSSGSDRFSWPRRICASTSPASSALADGQPQRQPSSSASANFSPALAVALVVEHVEPLRA